MGMKLLCFFFFLRFRIEQLYHKRLNGNCCRLRAVRISHWTNAKRENHLSMFEWNVKKSANEVIIQDRESGVPNFNLMKISRLLFDDCYTIKQLFLPGYQWQSTISGHTHTHIHTTGAERHTYSSFHRSSVYSWKFREPNACSQCLF